MKFGVGIPNCREGIFYPAPFAGPRDIVRLAQLAERVNFDSIWATDFINPSPAMALPDSAKPNWYELFVTLAYLAAATARIKVAAGVLLLPYRDPVIVAKQAATLDQFSGGRFLFGWGLGGFRDEFTSVKGKLRKAHRGRMLDEHMESLHKLLNCDGKVSFEGEYYQFHDVELNPKPIQRPLPIYISGDTLDTPARIAKWATGVSISVRSIAASGGQGQIRAAVEHMKEGLYKEGVDPEGCDYELSTQLIMGKTHEEAVEKFRNSYLGRRLNPKTPLETLIPLSLVGSPDDIVEQVQRMKSYGITLCMPTNIAVDTVEEMLQQVQWFGEEVIPEFRTES